MTPKPAFNYFGGKWNIAQDIIKYFPPHLHYVDGCGGSAAILLQKPPTKVETYNDLDGNVVNFFQVLRDKPAELIALLELTPWARQEYELSKEPTSDPVESARRFYVKINMTRSYYLSGSGMKIDSKGNRYASAPGSFQRKIKNLSAVAKRFISVQIESIDAIDLAERTNDSDTLFYYDPPYVHSTRGDKNIYAIEMSDEDHTQAAQTIKRLDSMIIVSGYKSALYQELYGNWDRIDIETYTQNEGARTESLWLSPNVSQALRLPKQLRMI